MKSASVSVPLRFISSTASSGASAAPAPQGSLTASQDTKIPSDGKKVQAALEELSLITPNGRYEYSKDDHSGLSPENVAIAQITGGTFVPTTWMTDQLKTNLPK